MVFISGPDSRIYIQVTRFPFRRVQLLPYILGGFQSSNIVGIDAYEVAMSGVKQPSTPHIARILTLALYDQAL